MFKANVYVTLRTGVLDPQGKAVRESLLSLGYDETQEVRIGKFIELTLDVDKYEVAKERVREMCEKLLVNTVIEDYRFELKEVTL
ncbi:phosphoribosylformylglycinamidine synthase [Vulcanibacillus modesticaldus]|uniref:Phosphoribosylformylglycinamidine synthase subunit PurS n=1 Tax=Vulcanibacillus modesticaldus TaxID=337097 RepID=A0A1D2YUU2_9BACI|nr:phosphoribosylformylglycinamidine synthase subunit PurS [Vulcanibacillus modesticaldus]OEF99478.1 phosphoribosylformylglycinamidine synthase [Vulcanibacillus modesticaldus]